MPACTCLLNSDCIVRIARYATKLFPATCEWQRIPVVHTSRAMLLKVDSGKLCSQAYVTPVMHTLQQAPFS